MKHARLRTLSCSFVFGLVAIVCAQPTFVNRLTIAGESTDLYQGNTGANYNRLGGPFSDLFLDQKNGTFYGLIDRGPGGGTIGYETRVQKFKVNVDKETGAISNFRIQSTILFKTADGSASFNGFNPFLLNGDSSVLGRSFDPEGFVVGPNKNYYVADEYGPSVYEFQPVEVAPGRTEARFVRAFTQPSNLLPRMSNSVLNFTDGRPIITTGRQDNRGYEGLTISPDGTKLYGVLQDPLVNEGNPDGRRGTIVRIVEFSIETGLSTRQFAYPLEPLADINSRVPGNTFGANAQGRNIGVSAILALTDTKFLVLERDNRGVGVEDALGALPVASKRIYLIDIEDVTDIKSTSLAGMNGLPADAYAVTKELWLDIAASLDEEDLVIPEKIEGLAIGAPLKDGSYPIFLGTDNDFSVTQNSSGTQLDVFTDGTQAAIDSNPVGKTLLPIYMYAFRTTTLIPALLR